MFDEPALSPRELAVRFADTESYFVSEASVYRLLKAHDLIASPAFIVMKAADEFKDKTTTPPISFGTYPKVIGWGWFYLSTVLDDFSRYIIAWKLCPTMKAEDVTTTLNLALKASGLRKRQRAHINVWRNKVEAMGLSIGPWLRACKQATLRGAPDDTLIEVAWRDRSSDTAAFLPLAVSKWRS